MKKAIVILVLFLSTSFVPVSAQYDYKEQIPGLDHPVSIVGTGHVKENADFVVVIDPTILEGKTKLKIDISVLGDKQNRVFWFPYPEYTIDNNVAITLETDFGQRLDSTYFEPIRNTLMGTLVDFKDVRYFTDAAEFIIKQIPSTDKRILFKFKNVPIVGVSNKIPFFITTEDSNMNREYYVAYAYTVPELLYNVKIKYQGDNKYYLSWDPIFKSTELFEHYQIQVQKRSHTSRDTCTMENAFINTTTTSPFTYLTLPEEESFIVRIGVWQSNQTNHNIDCGTSYYLYTPPIVGAVVPLVPMVSYRTDYVQPSSYYPPKPETNNDSSNNNRINTIEEKLLELNNEQEKNTEQLKTVNDKVIGQEKRLSFIERLVKKIQEILSKIIRI